MFSFLKKRMRNPYTDFTYDSIDEFMEMAYYNDIDAEFLVNFTKVQKEDEYPDLDETNVKELAIGFMDAFKLDYWNKDYWQEEYPNLMKRVEEELKQVIESIKEI